jgi:hypothetical protein
MLHHDANSQFVCKYHGFACPNEKDKQRQHPYRPIDENGVGVSHSTTTERLYQLTSSTCPILNIFAQIGIIRRAKTNPNIVYNQDVFYEFLRANIWYLLDRAHVRILISIMETFADFEKTQSAGTAACAFIRMERLARMVSIQKTELKKKSLGVIEGMRPTCATAPDTIINLFCRLHSTLFWHPLLWLVFDKILQFDLESEDHTFKRCDNLEYYKVFNFPTSKAVSHARKYLSPSTINTKYLDLYLHHHRQHAYGRAAHFPKRDANFLLSNGCTDIIDFGCGQGNRNNIFFTWTRYDPCVPEYSKIPNRSFSALISYDVLEHVPENELLIVARWLELLTIECMVLGISTRSAIVLANGENAHCTIRGATWWDSKITELLPEFRIIRSFPLNNYLVLHLKRLPKASEAASSL